MTQPSRAQPDGLGYVRRAAANSFRNSVKPILKQKGCTCTVTVSIREFRMIDNEMIPVEVLITHESSCPYPCSKECLCGRHCKPKESSYPT